MRVVLIAWHLRNSKQAYFDQLKPEQLNFPSKEIIKTQKDDAQKESLVL